MDVACVSQEDGYLYGDNMTKYPYISVESSGKLLSCTCCYVSDTDWAVLITPVTDKKIALLLSMLDIYKNL